MLLTSIQSFKYIIIIIKKKFHPTNSKILKMQVVITSF